MAICGITIHLFNNLPIVASSCGRQDKIDWVKFKFAKTFVILLLILYWQKLKLPNLTKGQVRQYQSVF
jgi:hypothetical protein